MGTPLEGLVKFKGPDINGFIQSTIEEVLASTRMLNYRNHSRRIRCLVAFSGHPRVSWLCAQGASKANMMARALGASNIHVEFMDEFYGVLGKMPKDPEQA